ncbi:MAG: branched-chain amino acid ABC transporter permease [Salaquimonas sp.]
MTERNRIFAAYGIMAVILILTGIYQSPSLALQILSYCLISSIMALGVNIQWGYAGIFNVGIMGFAAIGGLAAVLVSVDPVDAAIAAGGRGILISVILAIIAIAVCVFTYRKMSAGRNRQLAMTAIIIISYFIIRGYYDPAVNAIESTNAASTGFLGGFGLPILLAWPVGGLMAAAVAWVIGKIALGLRSDYLAIATLGISEIIVAMLKNEDWLNRGVKNVIGLDRPVHREVDLQQMQWFVDLANSLGIDVVEASSIFVKLSYIGLFIIVLLAVLYLSEKALRSPWGRMMRSIRDNEISANAMGKNITKRHLQVFVLGSAVVGIAGAMLTTLDGQFTPNSYQPLRFTFLIWVMVIVGGSGNNFGAILGGFVIWYFWNAGEFLGPWIMETVTSPLADDNPVKINLIDNAAQMRLIVMGVILLVVLRFSPRGLIPEKTSHSH